MVLSATVIFTSNTSWFLYNFRRKTIKKFVDSGYRVFCLAPKDDYSVRLIKELDINFLAIPLEGKSIGLYRELRSFFWIALAIKRLRPTIVFNSTIKMNVYAGIACSALGVPFANNVSGLGTVFIHSGVLFRLVRILYGKVNKNARHLFFENADDLKVFSNQGLLGEVSATVLPGSGVDLERFQSTPIPKQGRIGFLMIARLLGDKGVREYAGAARLLKEKGVDVRVWLLGQMGASNRTAISSDEIGAWESEGILKYLGATDDVRPYILQSSVLVLPSYREGLPRTILEGAAMGRPAIVTDVPGCRHSIEPQVTGWLCKARSIDSLADQMRLVAEMPLEELERAGAAARRRMEDHFSEERVVDAYMAVLDRI